MIEAICWALVHSLWQGLLLALAGGGIILSTRRSVAAVRYRLLCLLSGLFLAGLVATFYYELSLGSSEETGSAVPTVSVNWFVEWCSAHAWLIVAGWMTVAVLKSVRMAAGWTYLQQLRRMGKSAPALWTEKIEALSEQVGVRRTVKLVESALVKVPMVIGQLKPIIYIPLGLINHLPPGEMEAVLLHELAHIRRYDHLVNMIQQIAECVLFFNPGFLWISSIVREERENSCDDMAIAQTGDPVEFVRALVRFKEHSVRGAVLAFPGNRRQLLHRVLRISRRENNTLSGRERIVLLVGCLAILLLLAARLGNVVSHQKVPPIQAKVTQQEQGGQLAAVEFNPINAKETAKVAPELVQVLQTRQQVAQNMEWVQAQLRQLHKPGKRKNRESVNRMTDRQQVSGNPGQEQLVIEMQRERMLVDQQAERDRERALRALAQADQIRDPVDKANADRDRAKGDKEREQGVMDRQQAEQDRQQAERDRHQADLDRLQAERDRHQADMDRQQAMRDREQAERDRLQAQHDRETAELQRLQGELSHKKAELIGSNPKINRSNK